MFDFIGNLASAGINAWSGAQNRDTQMAIAQQNIAMQQDFARHGLGYRIEDAVAHGLSPLVGAGVTPASFSPVSVNSTDYGTMGQDVGRAVKAMENFDERKVKDAETAAKLQLEKGALENDLLRTEIASKLARENSPAQVGPPMQVPSGGLPRGYLSFVGGDRAPLRSSEGFAIDDDKLKSKPDSAPGVRNLNLWGTGSLKTNPNRASAQDLQNEYGDFLGDVLSIPNFISDAWYSMGQNDFVKHMDGRFTRGFARRFNRAVNRSEGGE